MEGQTSQQRRQVEDILFSDLDPVTKVKQLAALGYNPEQAETVVERHQTGQMAPVYYERLPLDLDEDRA